MKRLQAYQFELRPNGEQKRRMKRFAGACRFVYNKALAWQKEQYQADNHCKFSYTQLANLLPQWKQEPSLSWLKDSPSQTLQQALKNLERSFKNFFAKRAEEPKFKKRGQQDSFRYPQGFVVEQENSRVFLPKLGWMRYRNSRRLEGKAKNITVRFKANKWYMSIQTEREVAPPIHPSTSAVGVDVGVARFATLSTGEVYPSVNSYHSKQARLARYQRAMSRKVKFSQNWHKAKQRVAKLHHLIANIRKDYLHKTTTALSKNHALIVIEDLKIANMSKSAKGDNEQPGRNVKAKSGLNKAILEQGWYEFRRQLGYKQEWRGGLVQTVKPHYTSQRCNCCGHISPENRRSQAKFVCVHCGYSANADVNAAQNILAAGHAVLACGEKVQSDRSVKQEPAEGILNFQYSPVGIPCL